MSAMSVKELERAIKKAKNQREISQIIKQHYIDSIKEAGKDDAAKSAALIKHARAIDKIHTDWYRQLRGRIAQPLGNPDLPLAEQTRLNRLFDRLRDVVIKSEAYTNWGLFYYNSKLYTAIYEDALYSSNPIKRYLARRKLGWSFAELKKIEDKLNTLPYTRKSRKKPSKATRRRRSRSPA